MCSVDTSIFYCCENVVAGSGVAKGETIVIRPPLGFLKGSGVVNDP